MRIELTMPKLGFDMQEGSLVRWLKKKGDYVKKGEPIVEIETDKASIEVDSLSSGVVSQLLAEQGQIVRVGAVIALLEDGTESEEIASESKVAPSELGDNHNNVSPNLKKNLLPLTDSLPVSAKGKVSISPLARRIAQERGVQLAGLQGTGPGGMIVKKDVLSTFVQFQGEKKPDQTAIFKPYPISTAQTDIRRVPISGMRQIIAKRMTQSNSDVPQFTVSISIEMDRALDLRSQYNTIHEELKLSVNDLIVRAAALALVKFPRLNSSYIGQELEYHTHINIGVAVALDDGLITVVLHDADQKSLSQISKETKELVQRAREGKVRPDDIEGSTFTISNLGMYGIDDFHAIINPPEAGILAVGAVKIQPCFINGTWKPISVGKFNLSVDHRVSDGAEGAQYLVELKKYLEEPLHMI